MERSRFAGYRRIAARGRHITLTMAQLPKALHETILAEVMRRKRLAENVAINAVWRAFQRLGG